MKAYKLLKISVVCIILMAASAANKAEAQVTNHKAYSLFVYSFAKYSKWPSKVNSGDFKITVLGKTRLVDELTKMSHGKKVGNQSIIVNQVSDVSEIGSPHIVYISDFRSGSLKKVLELMKGSSTMVITERDGLVKKGAAVSFIRTANDKLRFQVNEDVFVKNNIQVSGSILAMAYKDY